jgi:hypothetical protein
MGNSKGSAPRERRETLVPAAPGLVGCLRIHTPAREARSPERELGCSARKPQAPACGSSPCDGRSAGGALNGDPDVWTHSILGMCVDVDCTRPLYCIRHIKDCTHILPAIWITAVIRPYECELVCSQCGFEAPHMCRDCGLKSDIVCEPESSCSQAVTSSSHWTEKGLTTPRTPARVCSYCPMGLLYMSVVTDRRNTHENHA